MQWIERRASMATILRTFGMAAAAVVLAGFLPVLGGTRAGAATPLAQASTSEVQTSTPFVDSVALAPTPDGGGYWEAGIDGGVFSFGDANFYGSLPGMGISVSDIVAMAATPDGKGYWLVGSDGGVFSFGDAQFYGSVPGAIGRAAPHPVTDIVPTNDGKGYWLVGSDGGVFSFGDAQFYGSLPGSGIVPNPARIAQSETYYAYVASSEVLLQPTPDDGGYWIADSSGDVFSFGDAHFYGSLPGMLATQAKQGLAGQGAQDVGTGHQATVPITGFVATPDGKGYWMAGTDGNVYTFGDAHSYGSLPSVGITVPPVTITGYTPPSTVQVRIPTSTVTGMARTADGGGYWLVSLDGGVFSFGDAQFHGSVPGVPNARMYSVSS
jgi:TM2 domain-containing membrane protein YozV